MLGYLLIPFCFHRVYLTAYGIQLEWLSSWYMLGLLSIFGYGKHFWIFKLRNSCVPCTFTDRSLIKVMCSVNKPIVLWRVAHMCGALVATAKDLSTYGGCLCAHEHEALDAAKVNLYLPQTRWCGCALCTNGEFKLGTWKNVALAVGAGSVEARVSLSTVG